VPVPARYGWGGPGSLLALPSGSIASDLRSIAVDRRRNLATYELLVANETISPVAAFAYAVGSPTSMTSWSTITVGPFASVAVTLDVPMPRSRRKQRVVVELHAEDAHLTLDAETPPPPRSARARALGLAAAVAAPLVAAALIAYALAQPHILALGTPKTVIAGRPFNLAYALAGVSGGNYSIETPQGFQIRRGVLERRNGSVALTLPDSDDMRPYDLHVTVANRFGTDSRIARITALPAPATPPPLPSPAPGNALPEVAVAPNTVDGGQNVGVSYPIGGGSADVMLIDQEGKVKGKALLDSSGRTVLLTPPVTVDQTFKVVVRAHEGNSTVESNAPLIVKAVRPDDFAPAPSAEDGSVPPPAGIPIEGAVPFGLASGSVRGGDLIRIAVIQHEDGLRLALTTRIGTELAASDVAPNQDTVALRAPKVAKRDEYEIVATFRRGVSQETVVRPIIIAP
jgi:hypothetical protein